MFELSVACKYLIPRRRQLSVSIISLVSVLVISLVVWLIVVFFSVTDGLEKNWVQKLTALTAPVRITPTDAYYHSYYYLVDSISENSHYSVKTIREKNFSFTADPYDAEVDEEIPSHWPAPDRQKDGSVKDLVKLVYQSIAEIRNVDHLQAQDFELTATHIRLNLLRPTNVLHAHNLFNGTTESSLSYPAYLGNFEGDNLNLGKTLLPVENQDLNNIFTLIGMAPEGINDENNQEKINFSPEVLHKRLHHFFQHVNILELKSRASGWIIPRHLFPSTAQWDAVVVLKDQQILRVIIPLQIKDLVDLQKSLEEQGLTVTLSRLFFKNNTISLSLTDGEHQISNRIPLTLAGASPFPAKLDTSSINQSKKIDELLFDVNISIQGYEIKGTVPFKGLEIAKARVAQNIAQDIHNPFWVYPSKSKNLSQDSLTYFLPKDPDIGDGIILPKSFRDVGVLLGDRGFLSYFAPTASILQEQQIPVYVVGFYDPGIIPIGGKFILASHEITSLIRTSHQTDDKSALTNGINVRFDHIDQADSIKEQLLKSFASKGISRYWNVETYREYEFTKEIMHELQSQKNLFMLIAVVIILVACSNIISMLIILVNDKKLEIGILRSMGASSKSIALIFGLSGALIGILGSCIGILAAILTLHHLDTLIRLLSMWQGHEMFSANVYGEILPHELSIEALTFVIIATFFISLLAGIVPAIKACLLRPSHILKSGGG